jgi:hypothetical protein
MSILTNSSTGHMKICHYREISDDAALLMLSITVTLTFEVGTWFLNTTHHLDVVDICAKLFQNPSMYDKGTVWTQIL